MLRTTLSHWRPTIVVYCVSIVVLFFTNKLTESTKPNPDEASEKWYNLLLSPDFWYQSSVTAGFRKPMNNNVGVVVIGLDEPKQIREDFCAQREFTAMLLNAVGLSRPKAIVIDKWYEPDTCNNSESTAKLRDAMEQVSKQVPIIYGRGAFTRGELQTVWPTEFAESVGRGQKDFELILKDTVKLEPHITGQSPESSPAQMTGGLVQLNADNRKIPLSWMVYDSFDSIGKVGPTQMDTLSVSAVKAVQPDRRIIDLIAELQKKGKHPFTSFLREDQFLIRSAISLVCANPLQAANWKSCQPGATAAQRIKDGRVIVIGQADPNSDTHETVVGEVPGVILQANYIESLLDDRIFRGPARGVNIIVGLLSIALIQLILKKWETRPWLGLLLAFGLTILAWWLINVSILMFGYYIELSLLTIIAVLGAGFAETLRRNLEHRSQNAQPQSS